MNVVYVSNEAYAQHFAVSLASLCDCNPDEEELKIYLLDTGILPETAEKLKELAADFGRVLTLIPLPQSGRALPGAAGYGAL